MIGVELVVVRGVLVVRAATNIRVSGVERNADHAAVSAPLGAAPAQAGAADPSPPARPGTPLTDRCRYPWCDLPACGDGYCQAHDDDAPDARHNLARGDLDD